MKSVINFRIPKIKPRVHRMLFEDDSPFKPKVVNPKNAYKRRDKHRNKFFDHSDQ